METIDPRRIKCVVFDFGFTLSPDFYFKVAPPGVPKWHEIIQEHIFSDPSITVPWMKGEVSSLDVAEVLTRYISLDAKTILATMEKGCEALSFNAEVWLFAMKQKLAGRKIALVTDNMDIFTKVVVPAHKLDRIFDAIVNSADEREIDKEYLWPIAYKRLGEGIGYGDSLLIEDGETEPKKFIELGGFAHQYTNEKAFAKWARSIDWGY